MRWIRQIALAGLLVSAPAHAEDVASLGWLTGSWVSETGGSWTEEHWTDARGGVMLGMNRSGQGDHTTAFEFMRIAADADGVVSFHGSPGGTPAVAFRLTSLDGQSALFENAAHDYPVTVRYWREGELLKAEVAGRDGANPMRWSFRRK